MAIMSFAHLKKTKTPPAEPAVAEIAEVAVAEQQASLSWVDDNTVVGRTFSRFPAVAETANIIQTNYCQGCPRFSRDEKEFLVKSQAGYGWCNRIIKGRREDGTEYEYDEWRGIPANAIVAQCVYKTS